MLSLHVCTAECGERAEDAWNYKSSEADADVSLYAARLRQTLRASLRCARHISSFWSTSLENQFWEMESLDFCLPGTRWDCVITAGR